ncbi:phosphonate ABC transporter ATP-binding protein [Paenibacillus sp. MBLB4367]|uniref:phosphonate ABC transporter ATP-binding protein n=1 Tax=Paenibacillus sp. MBLB4367 TaxID=3384767 RepID=UPI003907F412
MISIRNLTKKYESGQEVLKQISLQIDDGDFVALLGVSGSGKSTILRCLTMQEKWDKGQLIYNGDDVTAMNLLQRFKLRTEWAYLHEKPQLNPNKTALKNVLSGRFYETPLWRKLIGKPAQDEHMLAMDFLEKVGMLDKAHERVSKLSHGEQQRVAIAKALVKGAKIIVADEPVSGLEPESAIQVMQDLKSVCQKQQVTVVCSLHQIELAERFATRIWGLSGGKIVVDIPARKLTMREKDLIF